MTDRGWGGTHNVDWKPSDRLLSEPVTLQHDACIGDAQMNKHIQLSTF